MKKMTMQVVTPDMTVFEGEIAGIRSFIKGSTFAILPDHAPMMAALYAGEIRVDETADQSFYVAIDTGILKVDHNNITILTQMAAIAEGQGQALEKMEADLQARLEQNSKDRKKAVKTEVEIHKLLRQANRKG